MNAWGTMTVENLQMLVGMLEFGMWENRLVQSLLDTLDSHPEELLPNAIGLVKYAAFLLAKVGREAFGLRALLACLAWCIENGYETEFGPSLVDVIQGVSRESGAKLAPAEIRRRAIEREYPRDESWGLLWDSFDTGLDPAQADLALGIARGVTSRLPLTTFKGWLKRMDPGVLNASGRALMKEVFPRFSAAPSAEQAIKDAERLIRLGVRLPQQYKDEIANSRRLLAAGVQVRALRSRRFAGGDGRLPRGCYSSICSNAQGDDGGTLNREFMEYSHPCYPGLVFVGDSSDGLMKQIIGHRIRVLPGYCALYVFLSAPEETEERRIFNELYAETLELSGGAAQPARILALETRVDYVEIENVIDLRLPGTQKWLFDHFKTGDSVHLRKPGSKSNGQPITGFCDMVPTLMHPELGGCPATDAIGSWMRTSTVNALIYPSARSDAMISVREGQLVGFRGWNLVDYRNAAGIAAGEAIIDQNPWYDFAELGEMYHRPGIVLDQSPSNSPKAGSWAVRGVQSHYDQLYQMFIDLRN